MWKNLSLLFCLMFTNAAFSQEDSLLNEKYNNVVNYIKRHSFEFSQGENIHGENFYQYVLNYLKGEGEAAVKQLVSEHLQESSNEALKSVADLIAKEKRARLKTEFLLAVKQAYVALEKSKCLALREGEFRAEIKDFDKIISISRVGNQQVEIIDGEKFYYEVNWLSECECEFRAVSSFESDAESIELEVIVTRIYEINDDFYKTLSLGKDTGMMSDLNIRFVRDD